MTKQKKLFPEIEKKNFDLNDIKRSNKALEKIELDNVIISNEDEESYLLTVLKELFNKENVSTKTEYRNINENYTGTKLQFLAKYGNFPYLNEFIEIFEIKRISLERKGRIEIIKALEKREEEERRIREQKLAGLLGV